MGSRYSAGKQVSQCVLEGISASEKKLNPFYEIILER